MRYWHLQHQKEDTEPRFVSASSDENKCERAVLSAWKWNNNISALDAWKAHLKKKKKKSG